VCAFSATQGGSFESGDNSGWSGQNRLTYSTPIDHATEGDDRGQISSTEQHRCERFRHIAQVDLGRFTVRTVLVRAILAAYFFFRCGLRNFRLNPADSRLERRLFASDGLRGNLRILLAKFGNDEPSGAPTADS
jgi:hypothetical protein